jgi:hypothetical protein
MPNVHGVVLLNARLDRSSPPLAVSRRTTYPSTIYRLTIYQLTHRRPLMTSMLPLLDVVQETARAAAPGSPAQFSVFQLGKALYTLSVVSLVTAVMTIRAAPLARVGGPEARSRIDLALFWGAFTFAVGVFHVFMSVTSTTWSVQLFGPIGPDQQWLVARGLMLATIAGAWGTAVFLLAALAWVWLRRRHRMAAAPVPA